MQVQQGTNFLAARLSVSVFRNFLPPPGRPFDGAARAPPNKSERISAPPPLVVFGRAAAAAANGPVAMIEICSRNSLAAVQSSSIRRRRTFLRARVGLLETSHCVCLGQASNHSATAPADACCFVPAAAQHLGMRASYLSRSNTHAQLCGLVADRQKYIADLTFLKRSTNGTGATQSQSRPLGVRVGLSKLRLVHFWQRVIILLAAEQTRKQLWQPS